MPLSLLRTQKLREDAAGAREVATEEAPEKTVEKKPAALQIREAENKARMQ